MNNIKKLKPAMILYEFGCMGILNFVSEKEYLLKKITNDMMLTYYKLEYFREFDGVKDVIRYSKVDKKNNIVSYYTIRNDSAVTGSLDNDDEEISWNYNAEMLKFLLPRFKAFMDMGITFNNEDINQLCNNFNDSNNHSKLCRIRINQRNR